MSTHIVGSELPSLASCPRVRAPEGLDETPIPPARQEALLRGGGGVVARVGGGADTHAHALEGPLPLTGRDAFVKTSCPLSLKTIFLFSTFSLFATSFLVFSLSIAHSNFFLLFSSFRYLVLSHPTPSFPLSYSIYLSIKKKKIMRWRISTSEEQTDSVPLVIFCHR